MEVSNCCGASFYEPGWPDNDICSSCKEHADAVDEELNEWANWEEHAFSHDEKEHTLINQDENNKEKK